MEGGEPIELHASSWVVDAVWDGVHDSAEDQDAAHLTSLGRLAIEGSGLRGVRKSDLS